MNLYARAGFTVDVVLMDQEFDKIVDEILLAEVNTTAAREHVAEIERAIRVIKERCRGILSTLPFKYLPQRVLTATLGIFCHPLVECIAGKEWNFGGIFPP